MQAEALAAVRATRASGIVVMPCGSGKTSVFLQAAHFQQQPGAKASLEARRGPLVLPALSLVTCHL